MKLLLSILSILLFTEYSIYAADSIVKIETIFIPFGIKRDNITTSSVNIAFGFKSRKVILILPSANTDDICVSWLGGTAVCPAANTSGHMKYPAGTTIIIDDIGVDNISIIAASGTQTIYIQAWM